MLSNILTTGIILITVILLADIFIYLSNTKTNKNDNNDTYYF